MSHLIFLALGKVKTSPTSSIGPSPGKGSGPFLPLDSDTLTSFFKPSLAVSFPKSRFASLLVQLIHLSFQGSDHVSHPFVSAVIQSS
jgi:hypothetical protein